MNRWTMFSIKVTGKKCLRVWYTYDYKKERVDLIEILLSWDSFNYDPTYRKE